MPAGHPTAGPTLGRVFARICSSAAFRALVSWCAALVLLAPQPVLAWDAVRMAQAAGQLGPAAVAALGPLQALLRASVLLDEVQRVRTVNSFYNQRISFVSDREVWGQEDYWASPLQTLAQGRGDCEDYAIAKYATLLAAGVAPQKLQLVYVRARLPLQTLAQPHMVLTYQGGPEAEPLVLDNLQSDVLPASLRADLTPLFSFNAEGLWQDRKPAGDPLARLSRWREVWLRTRVEGFP